MNSLTSSETLRIRSSKRTTDDTNFGETPKALPCVPRHICLLFLLKPEAAEVPRYVADVSSVSPDPTCESGARHGADVIG